MRPISCPNTSVRITTTRCIITQKNSGLSSTLQFTEIKCWSSQSACLPLNMGHNALRSVDLTRFLSPKRIVEDYLIGGKKKMQRLVQHLDVPPKRERYATVFTLDSSQHSTVGIFGFTIHRNYDLTNLLLLEKLTGLRQIKEFPAFYASRRFVNEFSRARHLSVSYASRTQANLSFAPFIYVPFEHDIVAQRPILRAALLLAKFLPSFQITVGRATGSRVDPGCG